MVGQVGGGEAMPLVALHAQPSVAWNQGWSHSWWQSALQVGCARVRIPRLRALTRDKQSDGLWRSLVSALDWGSRGPGFKSRQPDHDSAVQRAAQSVAAPLDR